MRLIQTKDYLLLVDSDGEITRLSYVIGNGVDYIQEAVAEVTQELDSGRVIVNTTTELNKNGLHKIIAYYPIAKEAEELDLPLLPNPFKKEIDETILFKNLGHECFIQMEKLNPSGGMKEFIRMAVEFGYKAAQAKQFSLEDMIAFGKKCFYKGFDKSEKDDSNCYTAWREENLGLVQSLTTQQLPKEFVGWLSKKKCLYDFTSRCTIDRCDCEFVFETITNSKGKQELVGTYKY